jgi:hypothetical protein
VVVNSLIQFVLEAHLSDLQDDERKLIRKLSLLEKVLHFLGIVVVTLSTDPFDLPNLASTSSGLNVLEVNFGILTQIDNREVVIKG